MPIKISGDMYLQHVSVGTHAVPPGSPTSVVATAGSGSATVTFSAPADNGGLAVTGYTVTSSPAGGTDTNAGSTLLSHTITGLTNGVAYTFTVTATNPVGTSSASSASSAVTPQPAAFTNTVTYGTLPSSSNMKAVAYGGGMYVMLSTGGGKLFTSPDGSTWTSQTPVFVDNWTSAAYGNGIFVAISGSAAHTNTLTSTDGINWTNNPGVLPSQTWRSIGFGNGLFVATFTTSNSVYYSADGVNWSQSSALGSTNNWQSPVYGNGKWVVLNINAAKVATSTDGINWSPTSISPTGQAVGVIYDHIIGNFIIYENNVTNALTSTNGTTWSAITIPLTGQWSNGAAGNGAYVICASSGTASISVSTDGTSWNAFTVSPGSLNPSTVLYGNGKYIIPLIGASTTSYITIT